MKIETDTWAASSRKGNCCGIFGCYNTPVVVVCLHCRNHYCEEHKFVLGLMGHIVRHEEPVNE